MHSSIDNDGTQQDSKSRANSRPNTTPRFMHLQRRRIPCATEPQANRAIATAISRQRIDTRRLETKRDADGTAASCANEPRSPRHARPKARRLYVAVQNIQACFTSNKYIFTARKPSFCTIRRNLSIVSRCSTALAPRLLCDLSKNTSHRAHITPTLSLRDIRLLTQKHTADSRTFSSSHTTMRRARIAAQYMPLSTLAAQAVQSRYRSPLPRAEQNLPRAQHATTNGGTGESASRKPNAAQSTSCRRLLVLRTKSSINIDFLPMFHVKQRRLLHYGDRYSRQHYPCGSISISQSEQCKHS